jgi:outer membrane protein TolC
VQYKQGELQTTLSEAQYQLARQDLTLRAAQAYFDVLGAQDTLAAVSALYEANTQQLASWRRRVSRSAPSPSPMCMRRSPAPICRRPR